VAPLPTDIVTEVEAWLTAIGTALLGGATAAIALFGWQQFRTSGFTYSVRVIAGRPPTSLLVTIANKGRLDGHISAVRILKRPSAWIRGKNALLRRSFAREVSVNAIPQFSGALVETIQRPIRLTELTADLRPGVTVTFRVEFREPLPQQSFKKTWLLVRFGDGRVVKKRPKARRLSIAQPMLT
jgi:hypothetical protein